MFQTNTQGFVIIDLNQNSGYWMKPTDACMQFDFLGYRISVSTGASVLRGGCIVEHLVLIQKVVSMKSQVQYKMPLCLYVSVK